MIPLASLLRETARLRPDHDAVITDDARITYAELDSRADRLANALNDLGVRHGDRVAVMEIDTIEHIVTTYAIVRLGAVYVPINFRLRAEEVAYLVSDTEPVVFFAGPSYIPTVEDALRRWGGRCHLITLGPHCESGASMRQVDLIESGSSCAPAARVDLGDILQIQYSSGTTGLPKGAVLTHQTVVSRCVIGLAESPRFVDDVSYNAAPFFHVAGSQLDYMVHIRGATVVRQAQFEPGTAVRALAEHGVTCAFFVPSMINFMLQQPGVDGFDFSHLRLIEYGAAPMPDALLRRAMATFGCRFGQLFGAGTEGGLQAMLPPSEHRLDESERSRRRLKSIGIPTMFTEVRVVGEQGNEVSPGEVGEIISRGSMVMREYWGKPEATAKTLRDGWLHAGDMATVDEEGYLYLVDRKNDMIIRAGENIYPAEIELVLHEHPAVLEAAVIGIPDDDWGESVMAMVVLKPGAVTHEAELIEFCRSRMASYKKPTRVDFAEALPRNASGKILKRELRLPFWAERDRLI